VNTGNNYKEDGEEWGTAYNIPGDYYAGEVPRKEGTKVDLLGSAIFDGERMVGKLTGHESRILSIAKGIFVRGTFTIQDPENPDLVIPLEVMQKQKPKVTVRFDGAKPIINLKVVLEGEILAIQSRINYEDPKIQPIVERAFEKHIKEGLDRTIKKTQELNCDVFKFGHTAVRQFGTIQEWEAYDWNSHYKEAEVTTEVKFSIRRTGTQIYNSPTKPSEESNK